MVRMAELLGVSRSGFYAWVKRGPSKQEERREDLAEKITQSHAASNGVYGAPRVRADLRGEGVKVSKKTVAKIMRNLGLKGVFPRRFKTTTLRDNADTYPEDLAGANGIRGKLTRFGWATSRT